LAGVLLGRHFLSVEIKLRIQIAYCLWFISLNTFCGPYFVAKISPFLIRKLRA
jgi:hypothetical protein